MALVNHAKRVINVKIVFWGPPLAGKGTSLQQLFRQVPTDGRGTIKALQLQQDRMLFFDFMPFGVTEDQRYTVRCHLYTLAGEGIQPSSWRVVLKGADGVVFVADSQPTRLAANREAIVQLGNCLESFARQLDEIPLVFQCNKGDLAEARPAELLRDELGMPGKTAMATVASRGEGVLATFNTLLTKILAALRDRGVDPWTPSEGVTANPLTMRLQQPEILAEVAALPAAESPAISLAGPPLELPAGELRVPLEVHCGGTVQRYSLVLQIRPETAEDETR